jgi:hypothetical protein
MEKEYLEIFNISTDAVATNRGFYYQYLIQLKKWVSNFINDKRDTIYVEVDDDIKEVGDKLIFTQVKSYSSSFSFNSVEIRKTVFNFFMLFLEYEEEIQTEFCFNTNTKLAKSEKLLKAWIDDPVLNNREIKSQCSKKIKEIVLSELKNKKNRKLETNSGNPDETKKIKTAFGKLKEEINDLRILGFIDKIRWEFLEENPDDAIIILQDDIRQLLQNKKFQNKPVLILENVLLSTIYQASKNQKKEGRALSNETITNLLDRTDEQLDAYVNHKFIALVGLDIERIKVNVEKLQKDNIELRQGIARNRNDINALKSPSKIDFPKNITQLPYIPSKKIYGRDSSFNDVKKILDSDRVVYLSGSGGVGKTFFIEGFVDKYINSYEHIIWLNSYPTIKESLIYNEGLINNLKLTFSDNDSFDYRFSVISNAIGAINGKNLFVIDDLDENIHSIQSLLSYRSWSYIITTRRILQDIQHYKLPEINIEDAKKIFNNNGHIKEEIEEHEFYEFCTYIDFNPLIIELTSKIIANSIDLDLKKILRHFKSQSLDDKDLDIDLSIRSTGKPIQILSYLQTKLKYDNLNDSEKKFIEFFSLLPHEEILIDDLVQIGGAESYQENKIAFINNINSLHRKGWLEKRGKYIWVHRLISELVIYKERAQNNGFVSSLFLIIWLTSRIDENSNNPSKSFKFLKYAESILFSIKEPYRGSVIRQPLLILENTLLNAYSWLGNIDKTHKRWVDLTARAEKILFKNDKYLGVIYNNLALSYVNQYSIDFEKADFYFQKSLGVLRKYEDDFPLLLNSLNNILGLYVKMGNLGNANKILKEIQKLRKKNKLEKDQYLAAQFNIIGFLYQNLKNYTKALHFYNLASETHLEVDKSERNDHNLAMYNMNLSHILFLQNKHDFVVPLLLKSALILEEMELHNSSTLRELYNIISLKYEYYKDYDNAKKYREKFNNF